MIILWFWSVQKKKKKKKKKNAELFIFSPDTVVFFVNRYLHLCHFFLTGYGRQIYIKGVYEPSCNGNRTSLPGFYNFTGAETSVYFESNL